MLGYHWKKIARNERVRSIHLDHIMYLAKQLQQTINNFM